MPKPFSFRAKVKYAFDNFMSKGGLSVFFALVVLFIAAIVLMAVLRFVVNLILPDEKMSDLFSQWWTSFLQIADGGSIAEDSDTNWLNRAVGIIALFVGMVLFSSLVAFITSQFEEMLVRMRKGKSAVIEKNHTLILGFGDRSVEIIRELIIANESEKKAAVVVLAENEKDEMDDFFRDKIENWKTTKIITRSGATSSTQLLKRAGAPQARSIIILSTADDSASEDEQNLADAKVLKTILAVLSVTGEDGLPPILAEIHHEGAQKLAKHISSKVSIINDNSILAKLMVQTSRISGLAFVYDDLVGFEGNEFYFHGSEYGWNKSTYGEIGFRFQECSILGIRKSDGTFLLNPPKDTVLKDQDELILLAEDDSAIKMSRNPYVPSAVPVKAAKPQPKNPEKQLLVGWSVKAPMIIEEYSAYLVKDSQISVVVADANENVKSAFQKLQKSISHIKLTLHENTISDEEFLATLKPETFDNVIILTPDIGEAEIRDSETISKLLELRRYFKRFDKGTLKTQLITEVADSDNIDVIKEAGVQDFLISNQFVSKIYAQVSEEPEVLQIYDDLFREEGSEVYIKKVDLFLDQIPPSIAFGDLIFAALQRGESAFGVRIQAEVNDSEKNYGIYINPPKSQVFNLKSGDCLITLAEDES